MYLDTLKIRILTSETKVIVKLSNNTFCVWGPFNKPHFLVALVEKVFGVFITSYVLLRFASFSFCSWGNSQGDGEGDKEDHGREHQGSILTLHIPVRTFWTRGNYSLLRVPGGWGRRHGTLGTHPPGQGQGQWSLTQNAQNFRSAKNAHKLENAQIVKNSQSTQNATTL